MLWLKTSCLAVTALTAFAANSVLCRLALDEKNIDASSFTVIRLLSGIAILAPVVIRQKMQLFNQGRQQKNSRGSWYASLSLFVYALSFSFAYISLEAGTGALILFGAVQITIIFMSIAQGQRLTLLEWLGMLLACAGFFYLVLPGANAPSISGFILMSLSGVAWGVYTIRGKASSNPLSDTAHNFIKTLPFVIILTSIIFFMHHSTIKLTALGICLAIISGSITSGLGYAIWYMALRGLSSVLAATLQLLVPLIATLGGVIFIAEPWTNRLMLSMLFILGGILLVIIGKQRVSVPASTK